MGDGSRRDEIGDLRAEGSNQGEHVVSCFEGVSPLEQENNAFNGLTGLTCTCTGAAQLSGHNLETQDGNLPKVPGDHRSQFASMVR